jgi:hypothetical protein
MDYAGKNKKFKGNTIAAFQQRKILEHTTLILPPERLRTMNRILYYSDSSQGMDDNAKIKYASVLEDFFGETFQSQ